MSRWGVFLVREVARRVFRVEGGMVGDRFLLRFSDTDCFQAG